MNVTHYFHSIRIGKRLKQDNNLIGLLLSPAIPASVVAGVTVVSLLPLLLIVFGVDLSPGDAVNAHVHTILECSSIALAIFVAVLAMTEAGLHKNMATSVVSAALLFAAGMDLFHLLVSMQVVHPEVAESQQEPFSWSLVRTFNALVILVAASALLLNQKYKWKASLLQMLTVISTFSVLVGSAFVVSFLLSDELPFAVFSDDLVTHPYDVFPLVIWVVCGAFIIPLLKHYQTSVFIDALGLMVLPSVVVELHVVFGAKTLYDSHYFAAHFVKVVAFSVPLVGLLLEHSLMFRRDQLKTEQLHQTYREVESHSQDLLKANHQLQKISKYKSEFMASMSHELRTPLNSIIGFSRILMKDNSYGQSPRAFRANEAISRNALHLLSVINDIIDISRIDAGRMSLNKTDFILSDLIGEVKERLAPLAEEKSLEFTIINYARNVAIVSDKAKLKQVLINIGENAIKYTQVGSVVISVERQKSGPVGNCIKISIKDTGIGIPENEKEILYAAVGHPDEEPDFAQDGSSLGVIISARLTLLLGGHFDFDSEPNLGTDFRLYFPVAETIETHVSSPEGLWHRKGLAVVCVDADSDLLAYFEMAFENSGISLFTETSANRMMKLCEDVLPDVVCFDVDLPEKPGKELLRELYDHALMSSIPKVALGSNHELEHSLTVEGADLFVKKPCSGEDLCDQARMLAIREISSLLAVGVESEHAKFLQSGFESMGIKVFMVDNAETALEKTSQFLPDGIIINIGNEQADPTRLMVSLKNDEQCRKVPQICYNGLELHRRQSYSNDTQEEVRSQTPSAEDLLMAVFTLRRRVKTSMMRIEALNRSLKDIDSQAASEDQAIIEFSKETAEKISEEQRILVIENSQDNLALIEWILDDARVPFDSVQTGRDGLKVVLDRDYALVLVDTHLPDLDGREVTRRLRATKAYRSVPIVAITLYASADEAHALESAGFDDVVSKPIDQDRLINMVRQYCPVVFKVDKEAKSSEPVDLE